MACVVLLLLAFAYRCSNEVKQRCILRMQRFDKRYDWEQRDKHRRLRIFQMQWLDCNQLPRHHGAMAGDRKGFKLG